VAEHNATVKATMRARTAEDASRKRGIREEEDADDTPCSLLDKTNPALSSHRSRSAASLPQQNIMDKKINYLQQYFLL